MGVSQRRTRVRLGIVDRFRPRTDRRFLERVVAATLAHGRRRAAAVSLLLTDDAGIAGLHGQFLGDPTETDVMSFATDEHAIDVVVNVARARREAQRRGSTIRAELALYVVHGILHTCGYDDHDPRDRAAMREAEHVVLTSIGLRSAPFEV